MKKELEEKIKQKYFDMFHEDARGEARSTLIRPGFEHGDGWFDILWKLCEDIHAMRPKVGQIKEKFGGLRFYASFPKEYSEQGWKIIHKAEEESFRTCEDCGKPGELTSDGGWMKVLCKDCNKQEEASPKPQ